MQDTLSDWIALPAGAGDTAGSQLLCRKDRRITCHVVVAFWPFSSFAFEPWRMTKKRVCLGLTQACGCYAALAWATICRSSGAIERRSISFLLGRTNSHF